MANPLQIWNDWCEHHQIAQQGVQLFQTDECGVVAKKEIGKTKRYVLRRHPTMEEMVLRETDILVTDWNAHRHDYDGVIYMMYQLGEDRGVHPLYIGKAETFGKSQGNLSANLLNLKRDCSKFARWGDNYAYHIGDLSCACLDGHPPEKINPKYVRWASALFDRQANGDLCLRNPTFFWMKAWKPSDVSIWRELSPTRLSFLEYLLIGIASAAFGTNVLNYEGHNRVLGILNPSGP